MSRRVEITLVAASLLALGLVFFAWPPIRPLAVYRPPRALAAVRSEASQHDVAPPRAPTLLAREFSDGRGATPRAERERAGVPVPSRAQPASVRVHGHVTRDGRPVPGYDLLFHHASSGGGEWEEWEFTDEDGAFEVFLGSGDYLVCSDDEGPWLGEFVIPSGDSEYLLEIALPQGRIRGRVERAGPGSPVVSASVRALRSVEGTSSDAVTQGLMARGGEARTMEGGAFELIDLHPGDYLLVAEDEGRLTTPVHVVVTGAQLDDVLLSFEPGHTLEGVVRGPAGEPVAMELVVVPGTGLRSLAQLETSPVHYSNHDGEFTIDGLQPGPYLVIGRGETRTHDLALRTIVDFRPDTRPLELRAQRCGTLTITILHAKGTPVRGGHVDLHAHDGNLVLGSVEWLEGRPVSDEDGRIELDDVRPGWYLVAPAASGQRGAPRLAEVRAEATTRLELFVD